VYVNRQQSPIFDGRTACIRLRVALRTCRHCRRRRPPPLVDGWVDERRVRKGSLRLHSSAVAAADPEYVMSRGGVSVRARPPVRPFVRLLFRTCYPAKGPNPSTLTGCGVPGRRRRWVYDGRAVYACVCVCMVSTRAERGTSEDLKSR